MALVRWRPFDDLMNVQEEMSRFFEDFFGDRLPAKQHDDKRSWIPRVDISETDAAIVVKADVPGMNKEDIKVSLSENVLTISGEKRVERKEEKENFHRLERVFGSFERKFYIPNTVDAVAISAKYDNGVLMVSLPKKEEQKPLQIPVNVE